MEKKRSGFRVMAGLIGLIRPLLLYMGAAVILGCIGHLCAIFLTVAGGFGIIQFLGESGGISFSAAAGIMLACAVFRGIFRYSEQACNHFIAFKLLARIRHLVFEKLRQLAPAKLEGRERGNLISVITSDIELLEVFYAHTISPICIAVLTSAIMIWFIGSRSVWLGVIAAGAYLLVGAVIPIWNSRCGRKSGENYRKGFGRLNSVVLDNLRGMDEILQYGQEKKRSKVTEEKTKELLILQEQMKRLERRQQIITDCVILAAGAIAVVVSANLVRQGSLEFTEALPAIIGLMSSFGPVAALSSLSNQLNHTLACGNRVLDLLEEEPEIYDVTKGTDLPKGDLVCHNVSFSYSEQREVLKQLEATFREGKISGILGKSGCGKSTLLKLMLRFFDTDEGEICYGETAVREITTSSLRQKTAYVTQETFLFHDTIANNLRIAKPDATEAELIEAAKQASVHEVIEKLPQGYETKLGELGSTLSGGERQRLGIARAFLRGASILLLDEPTSNLDSLNEAVILKALKEESKGKTILLVSHRSSTMSIADEVIEM